MFAHLFDVHQVFGPPILIHIQYIYFPLFAHTHSDDIKMKKKREIAMRNEKEMKPEN